MNGGMIRFVLIAAYLATAGVWAQETAPASRPVMQTHFSRSPAAIPMEFFGSRPVISIEINGKGPFRFIVDTGTPLVGVADGSLLRELGLSVPEELPALNQISGARLLRLDQVRIGEVEITNVDVIPADFSGFMTAGADTPRGIVGLPLFAQGLLTLDYPRGLYEFDAGELAVDDRDVIAYSSDREREFGLTVVATVAGKLIKMHIDTGSPAAITLLNKWEKQLPLLDEPQAVGRAATPGGTADVRRATLKGDVKLGGLEFTNPTLEFADLGPMVRFDCGNIGSRMLQDFVLTIDQKNHRLRLSRGTGLKRPEAEDAARPAARYRVGAKLLNNGTVMLVDSITPGSPAEKAGLQAGDQITAIGGREIAGLGVKLATIFETPQALELTVRRGEETLTLMITPEPVKFTPSP